MQFLNENGALVCRRQGETLRIEAWGKDSLRVQATMFPALNGENWALTEAVEPCETKVEFLTEPWRGGDGKMFDSPYALITNGHISAKVNHSGVVSLFRDGKRILHEQNRFYDGLATRGDVVKWIYADPGLDALHGGRLPPGAAL